MMIGNPGAQFTIIQESASIRVTTESAGISKSFSGSSTKR